MDEKAIEAARTKPLQDEFNRIDAMKDRNDVLKEIAQAGQGGLGLPDRDYYTKTDDASKKIRDQYVAHVTKMLTLLGEPAAKADEDAKKILALETSLAQASR